MKKDFADYYSLMLKVDRDSIIAYFNEYTAFLKKFDILSKNNEEAKRILIEYLIIAIEEEIGDVTEKGNFLGNFEKMKTIWEKTFFKLENRFSRVTYAVNYYDQKIKCIAQALEPDGIIRLSYEFTSEVVDAPTRMVYFTPKPVLSMGGIHSVDKIGFMPDLHKNAERIDFYS